MNAMQQLGLAIAQHECRWRDEYHKRNIGSKVLQQLWDKILVLFDEHYDSREVLARVCKYVESQYV